MKRIEELSNFLDQFNKPIYEYDEATQDKIQAAAIELSQLREQKRLELIANMSQEDREKYSDAQE